MSRALETRVRCAAYQVEQRDRVLVAAVGRVLVARAQELREPPRLLALARALAHRRREHLEVLGGGGGGDGGKSLNIILEVLLGVVVRGPPAQEQVRVRLRSFLAAFERRRRNGSLIVERYWIGCVNCDLSHWIWEISSLAPLQSVPPWLSALVCVRKQLV